MEIIEDMMRVEGDKMSEEDGCWSKIGEIREWKMTKMQERKRG